MKKRILKMIKGEGGQALLLTLALLCVGSIMLAPLLAFMGTGLETGRVYESKERQIYAADAGVEDAIWKIQNGGEGLVDTTTVEEELGITGVIIQDTLPPYNLQITDPESPYYPYYIFYSLTYDIADVNSNSVRITIEFNSGTDGIAYKVISNAPAEPPADGSGTEIEAWVTEVYGDYTGITDHVVTSQSTYEIDDKVEVEPPGEYDPETNPNGAINNYNGLWPSPIGLINLYSMDVKDVSPYASNQLLIGNVPPLPPPDQPVRTLDALLREGTLSILRTGAAGGLLTLQLNGTVYITGNTLIGTTNNNFILDLNGQTIFVESSSMGSQPALEIGGKCTLTGSGCIIAVGDIKFQPKMAAEPEDYVLVLSIIGTTTMFPSGDFYGTLAGSVHVDVKSGETPHIEWNEPPGDLNFPGFSGALKEYGVLAWNIS